MNSAIFHAKNVIVQGITGAHGAFHTAAMRAAGTHIVAGTSPNKAGQTVDDVPVYATIADIQKSHAVEASVIFVPAPFAKAAMLEAIEAQIPLVVCITEGVPIHDMLEVKKRAVVAGTVIIGPNCPGVLLPGVAKLGITPASLGTPGSVAIVSRSGTLTYEITAALTARGIGQKYIIGIGGDRVKGTDFTDCLELFQNDPGVDRIVLVGEIGGISEQAAAEYIKQHVTKPVYAYVAGHAAPPGVQLGHAGAILGSRDESAGAKTAALQQTGAVVAASIAELVDAIDSREYTPTPYLEKLMKDAKNDRKHGRTTTHSSVDALVDHIDSVTKSREGWAPQIKTSVASHGDPTQEFHDMDIASQDGLESLPWDGESFEEWQKRHTKLP